MMNNFIEKWKSDKRYQTKIKLLLYTLFVVLVSIFAISGRNTQLSTEDIDNNQDISQSNLDIFNIKSNIYNYDITIKINEEEYKYIGNKIEDQETITKITNNTETKYIYKSNEYYKYYNNNYIITTENQVYDIIDHNLIDLKTINEYLKKSTIKNNQYQIYIKDLLLDSNNENTITILIENYKIEIDYTELMKEILDTNIEQFLVQIKIEQE